MTLLLILLLKTRLTKGSPSSSGKCRLTAIALCLLIVACQPISKHHRPVADNARSLLAARIQSPRDAGVTLTPRPDGSTRALNSHHFSRGEHDVLSMITRPRSRSLPLIRCRINNRGTHALVDTGSTRSLMNVSRAVQNHVVPVHPPGQETESDPSFLIEPIQTLGGRVDSIFSIADTLTLGEFQIAVVPFYIPDEPSGTAGQDWLNQFGIDTVMGFDVIKQFASVTFDYRRDKITFSRKPGDADLPNSSAAPLFVRFGLPVVPARFADRPVLAVIDTGGDFAIWVPQSAAENLNLSDNGPGKGLNRGKDGSGSRKIRSAGSHPIDLGGIFIPPSPVTVSLQPAEGPEAPVIFIGHRILQSYRVTLNLSGGHLVLEPQSPHSGPGS